MAYAFAYVILNNCPLLCLSAAYDSHRGHIRDDSGWGNLSFVATDTLRIANLSSFYSYTITIINVVLIVKC